MQKTKIETRYSTIEIKHKKGRFYQSRTNFTKNGQTLVNCPYAVHGVSLNNVFAAAWVNNNKTYTDEVYKYMTGIYEQDENYVMDDDDFLQMWMSIM